MATNTNGAHNGRVTLGLSGWLGQVANLTAVGIICLLFWQSQERQWEREREDRAAYAAQLEAMHRDAELDRKALLDLSRAVGALADEVKALKRRGEP
jgi:hypothetical protein